MLQGQAQFLVGHHHPAVETALSQKQFMSHAVGLDVLVPVCQPQAEQAGRPTFQLPGSADDPVPYLSYRTESGMGRIVHAVRQSSPNKAHLRPTFNSHLARLLVTMALEGRGMAWLPKSLIEDDLAAGKLVRAGDETWDIPIEIHVFRSRARLPPTAESLWSAILAHPPSSRYPAMAGPHHAEGRPARDSDRISA